MKRVTGIGGIFFKTKDPEATRAWYQRHLGIAPEPGGYVVFPWRDTDDPERTGTTVWSLFQDDTDYFDPSPASFMINYRVADLHGLIAQLREEGIEVIGEIQEYEYGRFGWILDPDGNKIELWEPPEGG